MMRNINVSHYVAIFLYNRKSRIRLDTVVGFDWLFGTVDQIKRIICFRCCFSFFFWWADFFFLYYK